MLVMGITVPVVTYVAKRLSLRQVLNLAWAFLALGALINYLTSNFWVFLIGRIFQAIATGIAMPVGMTFAMLNFPPNRQGTAMGISGMAVGFAPNVGPLVGGVFFLTILIAALTSSISMMEGAVAFLVDETRLSRPVATGIIFAAGWVLGACCAVSGGVFNFFDQLCSNYLMPFGALIFTLFVGWKMTGSDMLDEFTNGGTLRFNKKVYPFFRFLVRYIAPVGLLAIFLTNLFL